MPAKRSNAPAAVPQQQGIAHFFARSQPKDGGATAAEQKGTSNLTSKPEKENKASPTEPAEEDGQKRKRLRRAVIEESPSKSDQQEELADLMDIPSPAKASAAPAQQAAEVCSTAAADPEAACPPEGCAAKAEEAADAEPPAVVVVAAAVAASPPPKKLASIFEKPKATAKGAPAAGALEGGKKKKKPVVEEDEEEEVEEEESDGIVESDDDVEGEGEGGAKKGASKTAKASKRPKAEASKVDGVGLGAVAAAAKHGSVDIDAIVGGKWTAGQPVPFELLADTFESIAETSKRLDIINLLINCFRAILATTPEDLLPALYLCTNRVAPAHLGIELGVGEGTLIKALSAATGRTEQRIKEALREEGDLGTIAVKFRSTQKTLGSSARLTIRGVFKAFKEISVSTGKNCQKVKEGIIVKQLVASKGNEAGYVMRSLQAKLRIGLAEQSVLVALAHSILLQRDGAKDKDGKLADRLEQASQQVKQAYSECPSYEVMVPALLSHPLSELPEHCHFMPGVPIKPMLAKATNSVGEVLDKFQDSEFTCEYKYDGERAQLHVLENGSVMIFSRNSENNTGKYPDIVQRVHKALKPEIKSIVLDSEAVAWDKDKKKILPFQVLSTRKRKGVDVADIDVQVCVFAFDCLYINGRSLLRCSLEERRQALYGALQEVEGEMQFATAKTSRDVDELQRFLDEAVEGSTEGLIVKTMGDTYEPAKRSSHWLKLKKDYLEGVGDTIDVVPIGGFFGKGKRTGLFGAYLLSVYDPETESYQTISKLGTGFSEEMLQQLSDQMTPHIIPKPKKYFSWSENLQPDVWFDAVKVWEVKAADLSISPVHKAATGLVDPVKGISIRFPRLLRVRDDKGPEDSTSAEQIADMFRKQACHRVDTVKDEDEDA